MNKERDQGNKRVCFPKFESWRQELDNFGKCQSACGQFGFPKRADFHLKYVLGESIYQFQPITLQIAFTETLLASSTPDHGDTYAGPSRRASRLARGWAPWTCWASSAARRWCRPGFPGQPAWTWPWAGWRWWCWAQKWRPWGTRRRWTCWPAGERCGTVKRWEGSAGQESVVYFSKQERHSLQWKAFRLLRQLRLLKVYCRGRAQPPLTCAQGQHSEKANSFASNYVVFPFPVQFIARNVSAETCHWSFHLENSRMLLSFHCVWRDF